MAGERRVSLFKRRSKADLGDAISVGGSGDDHSETNSNNSDPTKKEKKKKRLSFILRMKKKKNGQGDGISAIDEDAMTEGTHLSDPDDEIDGKRLQVTWVKGQGGQDSSWRSRAVLMLAKNMLVFGAVEPTAPGDSTPTELYVLDAAQVDKLKWSRAVLRGAGPGSAPFHAALSVGTKVYVLWSKSAIHKSMFRVTKRFSQASTTGPKFLTLTEDQTVIVQKVDESNPEYFVGSLLSAPNNQGLFPKSCVDPVYDTNSVLEVSVLNVENMTWMYSRCKGDNAAAVPSNLVRDFSCVVFRKKIYLFGGLDDQNRPNNALYCLDTETLTWVTIEQKGEIPAPRSGHAALISERNMIIFGGKGESSYLSDLHSFDLETLTWIRLQTKGAKPSPRANHSLTLCDGKMILIGGDDGTKALNDVYVLSDKLSHFHWSKPIVDGEEPAGRCRHFSAPLDKSIIIFGGSNLQNMFFDLYFLRLGEEVDVVDEHQAVASATTEPKPAGNGTTNSIIEDANNNNNSSNNDNAPRQVPVPTATLTAPASQTLQRIREERSSSPSYGRTQFSPSRRSPIVSPLSNRVIESAEPSQDVEVLNVEEEHGTSASINGRKGQGQKSVESTMSQITRAADQLNLGNGRRTEKRFFSFVNTISFADHTFTENDQPQVRESLLSTAHLQLGISTSPRTSSPRRNGAMPSAPKSKEKQTEYSEYLKELFEALCATSNPNFDDQNAKDSLEYSERSITVTSVLKFARNCRMLENSLSWDDALNVIKQVILPEDDAQLHGDEPVNLRQFKKIVFELAVKKYKNKLNDTNIVCYEQMMASIKKNFDEKAFHIEDYDLDDLLDVKVIALFTKHKKMLTELFTVFSTLNVLSAHAPSWDDIVKNGYGVTSADVMAFAQSFDLTPLTIPRHAISKKIVPQSYHASAMQSETETIESLSYPEFIEVIGRMALYLFSRYPYASMLRSPEEKVTAFFERLGFFDRKKFTAFLKKSGLGTLNKTALITPKKSSKPEPDAYEELLRDKERLKDELQRIFMYYCSFGDHLNLELMGQSKFSKFVKDIKVISKTGGIKVEDVDLIYIEVMKSKKRNQKEQQITQSSNMTFDLFMESLQVIATRMYGVTPQDNEHKRTEALVKLLMTQVLPYAQRVDDKFTQVDPADPAVQEILEAHRKQLQAIFYIYSGSDADQDQHSMSINEFLRFANQFEIVPTFVSKTELYRIFRSAFIEKSITNVIANEDIHYKDFEACLVKCAYIGYSKHPYTNKFPTLEEKIEAFLHRLGLPDWDKVRRRLATLGHKVASSPQRVIHNKTAVYVHSSKAQGNNYTQKYESLPTEKELDSALRDIFAYYMALGDKAANRQYLGPQQYLKFCRDSQLLGDGFTAVTVDLIFSEITKHGSVLMNYELFCDSLSMLAQRKFPSSSATEALRELLLHYILPHAQREQSRQMSQIRAPLEQDIIEEMKKFDAPLRKIFVKYSRVEAVKGSVEAIASANTSLSSQELIKLCHDFDVCPDLLNISDVIDLFRASNFGHSADDQENELSYEEFVECWARCALKAFSVSPWAEMYPSNVEKVRAFIHRMDISDANKLNSRLQRVDSFSLTRLDKNSSS